MTYNDLAEGVREGDVESFGEEAAELGVGVGGLELHHVHLYWG